MSGLLDHLEKLAGFKGVADLQSFHKAAARLNVSQPSLSSSIKILESIVGRPLFIRSHKGVTLTPEGAVLLEFTNRLFQDIKTVEADLSSGSVELVGSLRVGLYESIAIYFWPLFFKKFQAMTPKVGLRLTTGRSSALIERLEQQELDIVVTVEPKMSRKLRVAPLYSDSFAFYASREVESKISGRLSHLNSASSNTADSAKAVSEALHDIPVIILPSAANHHGQPLEQSLLEIGFNIGPHYEVESFEAAKEIAANGVGVALLPTRVALAHVQDGRLVKIEIPGYAASSLGEHSVCMVTLENSQHSRLVAAVTTALVQHLSD